MEQDLTHESAKAYMKVAVNLRKWEDNRTPDDGEPDDEILSEFWQDTNGNRVTDPRLIERLEASLQSEETEWHS